jgi:[ribosomal protein S18]-alanine N-acetyltransferase
MSPAEVHLRHARASDLDAIVTLERATVNAPHWPPAAYAEIVEPQNAAVPQRCLFVAQTTSGALVGFAAALIRPAEATAELETVAVAVSARRAGIGRALCAAALDWCRDQGAASIVLEVRANSAAAIAMYTDLGFVPVGRRPVYYRDPEDDALILRLQWN